MGDDGPEHAISAHYRLMAIETGLPVPPVQRLVPDITQLDCPVGALRDLYLQKKGLTLGNAIPSLAVSLIKAASHRTRGALSALDMI